MARTCVFCGGGGSLTKEHVYPEWLRDAMPLAALYKTTNADGQSLWEQGTFDVEARIVCATCNNGWMSDLEAACGPLLVNPILYGSTVSLDAVQQRLVALWAIKTAVVLETYRKERTFAYLPQWHARWMPRTRASGEGADPPAGISVVAFGRQLDFSKDSIEHFATNRSLGLLIGKPPNDSKGYVVTFIVGYMGFQIFGVNVQASGLPNIWYSPWVTERTISLWPPVGAPVTWPPALASRLLGGLCVSGGGGERRDDELDGLLPGLNALVARPALGLGV